MPGIEPEDRFPLLAACIVMVLGNVVGFLAQWTVYMSILFAPLAIVAFGATRYFLIGEAFPRPMKS